MYTEKEKRITPETEMQEVYMALGEFQGRFDAVSAYLKEETYPKCNVIAAILGVGVSEDKKED